MKPLPLSPAVLLICFWVGALLLTVMTLLWRSAVAMTRRTLRYGNALDIVLTQRRGRLSNLLARDATLTHACRGAELATAREESLSAEAAIDDRVQHYINGGTAGFRALEAVIGAGGRTDDVQAELADWSARVAVAAARYNESAMALNIARRTFPVGIALRAQAEEDMPLYGR